MPKILNKTAKLTDLLDPGFMARLDGLDVASRRILLGRLQGERRSKRRGHSVEFADHRPYVVGDDLRFVDWNVYGRLDQLFLKLFLEEQDLSVTIAFDCSASMTWPDATKNRFVRQLAAALGYVSLVHNNRVTVCGFSDTVHAPLRHMRGRAYLPALAEMLLSLPAEGVSLFDAAARQLETLLGPKGIVLLISDFFFKDGYESGLKRLIARGHDLYVLQTLAPQEIKPAMSGDLRLVDLEDGDVADVTMSRPLLKAYERNLNAYCHELKETCSRHQAVYVLSQTQDSVEQLVLNTLRRNRLLK